MPGALPSMQAVLCIFINVYSLLLFGRDYTPEFTNPPMCVMILLILFIIPYYINTLLNLFYTKLFIEYSTM